MGSRTQPLDTSVHLTERQRVVVRLYRQLKTDKAVGEALGIRRQNAGRMRRRAMMSLRKLHLLSAVGGDPVDAMDAVLKIISK